MGATSCQAPILTTEMVVAAARLDAADVLGRVGVASFVVLPVLGVVAVGWHAAVPSSWTRADWDNLEPSGADGLGCEGG